MVINQGAAGQLLQLKSRNASTDYLGIELGGNILGSARFYSQNILAAEVVDGGIEANAFAEKLVTTTESTNYTADVQSAGAIHAVTLGADILITPSAGFGGTHIPTLTLILIQDATGTRIPTFPASVKWEGGTVPTWSTAAGAEDIVTMFTYDNGASWRANLVGQGYA